MPQTIQNAISIEISQAKLGNVTVGQSLYLLADRVRKGWITVFLHFCVP